MKIDNKLIEKIGELAHLDIKDDEKPKFSEHLAELIDYMDDLASVNAKVNVQNVEPMFHGCVEKKELRSDVVIPFDPAGIMNSAYKNKNNYFYVPNIIDGDEE